MAERMIEKNYQAMLDALYNFVGRTNTLASNMQTLALVASSALEEEDSAVPAIYSGIKNATLQYDVLAKEALHIAKTMAEELNAGKQEASVWADED